MWRVHELELHMIDVYILTAYYSSNRDRVQCSGGDASATSTNTAASFPKILKCLKICKKIVLGVILPQVASETLSKDLKSLRSMPPEPPRQCLNIQFPPSQTESPR